MKNVFIIGSKGIPANYGGFESFVENLTHNKVSEEIKYHVSCMSNNFEVFEYNKVRCFNIKVPNIGVAKAVYCDIKALTESIRYIRENKIHNPVVYILACRIGPFINHYKKQIKLLGGNLYVNPDGYEWKRKKWNGIIKKYWKISEYFMVKHAEVLICDSKNIEKYIRSEYKKLSPNTRFIAYGADTIKSLFGDDAVEVKDWYRKAGLKFKGYYLVVGRFVPENNFEIMIKEFMKSDTDKDFVLITNVEKNKFYEKLRLSTGFDNDKRIKFVGTVYDFQLLKKIRENAFGYFHGHEVGGTNPSLLESLGSTDLNLLLDVKFNKEVGEDCALYWTKQTGNLSSLINSADKMTADEISEIGNRAKRRINEQYSWERIVGEYEKLFLGS